MKKRQSIWKWMLVAALLLSCIGNAGQAAADEAAGSTITLHQFSVLEWNGKRTYVGRDLYLLEDNVMYLSPKAFSEVFGMKYNYDKGKKLLTLTDDQHAYELTVGSKQAKADGEAITIKHALESIDGKIGVPLSFGASIRQAQLKPVDYFEGMYTDPIAAEDSLRAAYEKVSGPYDKAYSAYEKAYNAYESAVNQNLYYVQGDIAGFDPIHMMGTSEAQSSHVMAELFNQTNIVVQNPDKSKISNNRYSGYHYFVKTGTGHNFLGEPVSIYYFGAPSASIQKNINAKKSVLAKAEAALRTQNKPHDTAVSNWVQAVKSHYKKKGASNPKVLGQMATHLYVLYLDTGAYKFDDEAKAIAKSLEKSSQHTYWLVRAVFDEGDFRDRFEYFYKQNKGEAMSLIYKPEQFKAGAEMLYNMKLYDDALPMANEAKQGGQKVDKLLEKLKVQLAKASEEKAKQDADAALAAKVAAEMPAYTAWESEYKALLAQFKTDYTKKYGNLEALQSLTFEQSDAQAQEIKTKYSEPLAKLKKDMGTFQYVDIQAAKDSISSFEQTISYVSSGAPEVNLSLSKQTLHNALINMGLTSAM
ncbi:copper amine oxidase N-terminal domain-containing protein [Paenibacillus apiarius]|uniref:copper amine oxidase N-terminal domain-containing protein n=1 Tax=Paenibacillus apiarius TaxID=46240 RepID=UPI00198141C5|nr:copper amine oxidase N-terminal domain-containing protein [Paenibacillus apiarius]MBN3527229.1 hypothetical protein [Paenibacillus apiarius]